MNKETSTIALALIAILAIVVALQPIIPSNNERFSELGVLGPNQTIANYPTSVVVGQPINLYLYVGNHEGNVYFYKVILKIGDRSTQISNSTFANATEVASYGRVLDDNQSWTVPVTLSLHQAGQNERLIFELWAYNATTLNYSYLGLWNQLWMNVTST